MFPKTELKLYTFKEYHDFTANVNQTKDVTNNLLINVVDKQKIEYFLNLQYIVLKLNGEIGELFDVVNTIMDKEHNKENYYPMVIREVGDILWYLSELCNVEGLNFQELLMGHFANKKEYEDFTDIPLHCSCKDVPNTRIGFWLTQKTQILSEKVGKKYRNTSDNSNLEYLVYLKKYIPEMLKDLASIAHNIDSDLNAVVYENMSKLLDRVKNNTIRSMNRGE